MPNKVYNGTNPITDILGDLPTEREVTMTGLSTLTRIEPLTNTQIPAGQTVLVNVIGDMAHAQLVKNIQQINALEGFDVIGVASVVVGGGGEEPTPTQLMLIPTGATESVDGEFQRFAPDATDPLGYPAYYAELDAADWQESPISVQFKWPDLTVVYDALLIFFSSGNYNSIENSVGDETDSIYALLQLSRTDDDGQGEPYNFANFDFYKFGVEPPTSESVTLTPIAGDIATLDFTRTQMTLTVGGETQAYAIPAGIFTGVPLLNVVAKVESAALPLSIKVAPANEQ